MEHFYDKMKSVYEGEQQRVPEGYSWDNMKEGINQKMQEEDRFLASSTNILRKRTGLLLIFLIVFGSGYFLIWKNLSQKPTIKEVENTDLLIAQPQSNSNDVNQNVSNSEVIDHNVKQKNSLVENEIDQSIESTVSSNSFENKNQVNSNVGQVVITESTNSSIRAKGNKIPGFVDTDLIINEIADGDKNKNNGSQIKKSNPSDRSLLIKAIPQKIFFLQNTKRVLKAPAFYIVSEKEDPCNYNNKTYLGVASGTNLFHSNFGGDDHIARLRKDHTKPILGQQVALVFKKPIKRSYFISVGIGYNNMHEELDVQFDKPVTKLIKDALVRVDSNIITDRKTYYIKDTMVGAVERRRVLHYNTFRTLNLNTSVGKSFCINQSWSFNMQLGLQYTRLVHETGRQLGADYNIIDFNASRRLHLDNHLALTSGFSTLYNLREHYYLMGECFVNQYVTNWSLETEVTNYPTVFGLKLAVLYVF